MIQGVMKGYSSQGKGAEGDGGDGGDGGIGKEEVIYWLFFFFLLRAPFSNRSIDPK